MSDDILNKEIITKKIKKSNIIKKITNQPENIMLTRTNINNMAISDMFNYDESFRIIYNETYDILMPFFINNIEKIINNGELSEAITEEKVIEIFIKIKNFYDMIFFQVMDDMLYNYKNDN